jgi:hypothetical protein
MLNEEERISRNDLLSETARLMQWALRDPALPAKRTQRRKRSKLKSK